MLHLPAPHIPAWVRDTLLSPARGRPVVALTTHRHGGFPVDLDEAEALLGDLADLVAIETGDATWALSDALPDRLDVYGGAFRVWWPGLTEDSDPYDHKLYLVHTPDEGMAKLRALADELRQRTRSPEESCVEVVVEAVEPTVLLRSPDGRRAPLTQADYPVAALAVCLTERQTLRAIPGRERRDGSTEFSVVGLLPDPWERIAAEVEVGDVLLGRVLVLKGKYALIELLPGAKGIVGIADADWSYVHDVADVLRVDEIVPVVVLELDPERPRAQLSVKQAQTANREPRQSPSLVPGGAPFDWHRYLGAPPAPEPADDEGRLEALQDELEAANEDRATLRRQVQELRAEVRSQQDRFEALERRRGAELDPLQDERAFLMAVRMAYARDFGEGDRLEFPLQRMRVGAEFLDRLRALDGIDTEKVIEVCAQVACDKARTIAAREVHPLREGAGGADQVTRARDGAKAWRCALQVNTPSARRLHWWRIPGADGATIEFAAVGVHDEVGMPG